MNVTELELDRTTSAPKSVLHLFGGSGSGALIWNWASTALVLLIKFIGSNLTLGPKEKINFVLKLSLKMSPKRSLQN